MIDFAAALNEALNAAIDRKLALFHQRLNVLESDRVVNVTRVVNGDVVLTAEIEGLVDNRIEYFLEKHNEDYVHDDFVTDSDLESKVDDVLDEQFASKFDAALDGTRVTLNT
jgi:hypothetical protein